MALINVQAINTFNEWRLSTNELGVQLGDNQTLLDYTLLDSNNIVDAVIELSDDLDARLTANDALELSRYQNTLKLDLTHSTVNGNNNTIQTIESNISTGVDKTITINGTLDITNGTLIFGGTGANVNLQTTWLTLGDTTSLITGDGGIIVTRGLDSSLDPRVDVRIYWDESNKEWHLQRIDSNGDPITPFIMDSANIVDFITGNTESGIDVTYNSSTNKIDFNVNDPLITLTGAVTGSATMTNLGNVTIATSYDVNTVKITSAQNISGVKTFTEKPIFLSGITSGDHATDTSTFNGDVTMNNSLIVATDLTVSGSSQLAELAISDNIIILNNDVTAAPTQNSGFEIERGTSTNSSILWNETDDAWAIYDGVTSLYVTGQVTAGNAITTSQSADKRTWTVNHADTSPIVNFSVDNSGGTVIQDLALTFDTYGHVQTITTTGMTINDFGNIAIAGTDSGYTWGTQNVNTTQSADVYQDTLTIVKGGGINLYTSTDGSTDAIKIEHADTSTQATITNTGTSSVIQSLTLDTYGHITTASSVDIAPTIRTVIGAMFDTPNTEQGIDVYLNTGTTPPTLTVDVHDFNITLTGAINGTATVNNLGSVSIATTVGSGGGAIKIYNVAGTQVFP